MAVDRYRCPKCGGEVTRCFGDRFVRGELIWSVSHQCGNCRYAVEEDGGGRLPPELRQEVIAQDGLWAVRLPPGQLRSAAVLKALRESLGLSMGQLRELLAQESEEIGVGTQAEASSLLAALKRKEISATLLQAPHEHQN